MATEKSRKIIFSEAKKLAGNSWKMVEMIYKEQKVVTVLLVLSFILVSAVPFLNSGARGLLINYLVKAAGKGTVDQMLILLIGINAAAALAGPLIFTLQDYLLKLYWFTADFKITSLIVEKRGR